MLDFLEDLWLFFLKNNTFIFYFLIWKKSHIIMIICDKIYKKNIKYINKKKYKKI
jgi:hypothetical protein